MICSGDDVKPCPRCSAMIIKMNDGSCNHMTWPSAARNSAAVYERDLRPTLPEVSVRRTQNQLLGVRKEGRKEGNVLFNDALNTFYLRLYGIRHMVKNHSESERGNPLPPHRLLFPISSKGSFICIIPQTG